MLNKRKYECIVCGKEFERYSNNHGRRPSRVKSFRKSNSITCSKNCSKVYDRVRRFIDIRWRIKLKRNGIDIKKLNDTQYN